jgi:hypothetical protein
MLFGLLVATACTATEPRQVTPDQDSIDVDGPTADELRRTPRELQSLLASDGRIDRAEYDRLVQAYRQCVNEAGASFSEDSMETAYGTFHIVIRIPPGLNDGVQRCTEEFWDPLGPLWSHGHQLSQDQIRAANEALGECLRASGEDFPYAHPTLDDFHRFHGGNILQPSMLKCSREVGTKMRIPGFAGG